MRTIQEVGAEILQNNPKSFYIFGGSEYGIKCKYLDILKKYYNNNVTESNSVLDIIDFMNTKHIVPVLPGLYIVRYDESFVSSINSNIATKITNCKIIGTIVCIYENSKHVDKLNKFLPDNTVTIDEVNPAFVTKYLKQEFSNLPDRMLNLASSISANYGQARNICNCMQYANIEELYKLSDSELSSIFGIDNTSTELQIKLGIASKNFKYTVTAVDKFTGDLNNIYYAILSLMIELDKLIGTKYGQSQFQKYIDRWTHQDIYYMFMHTYAKLKQSRSGVTNIYEDLIYLISLVQYSSIPNLEVLNDIS